MNLEAFVLGCGGMMPLPGRHLTSVLLRREGDLFLFDCGEGTQVSLRSLNLRWKKITAILISHTHADHVTGLPGILMLSAQVDRDEPLTIIGPARIREYIESTLRVLEPHINYRIDVREIPDPSVRGQVFSGDGYTIRSIPLDHTRTCVGYVFEENERPGVFNPDAATALRVPRGPLWAQLQRGEEVVADDGSVVRPGDVLGPPRRGRKFSYVTDTRPAASIPSEVTGSDLLICEGMFHSEFADTAREKKHMTAREAGETARAAGGVKKMGLIHYSPRYTNNALSVLKEEAQEVFPASFLARDRMTLDIPYDE